ncbi:MAG: porin family protein [Gammaproteobacteria bacterium]|nr:porin family protein [Gammaproteobacteria bacterium]
MKNFLVVILFLGFAMHASAETEESKNHFDADKLYFGGGLSENDFNGPNATGIQIFVGYPLTIKAGSGRFALEGGYMNSGSFDRSVTVPAFGPVVSSSTATGLWGTIVGSWNIADRTSFIGRLGLDMGDDDGLMYGAGIGYDLIERLTIRGEYVIRDNIDSLQFNFVFR